MNGDRGQLILVAGLGLAVTLVALALILNSAIYTENLASRDIDSGSSDLLRTQEDVQAGLGGAMDGVNGQSPAVDYPGLTSDFKTSMTEWNGHASRYTALRGQSLRLPPSGVTVDNGVRIADDDASSPLRPRTDPTTHNDWTVAPSVRARSFTITAYGFTDTDSQSTVESDLGGSDSDGFFYVDIDNGQWRLAIYDDAGTVKVTVYDGSSTTTCSAQSGVPVQIDIGEGTVNGIPCEAISTVESQAGPYTVEFENGDEISQGTFELTADRVIDGPAVDTGPFTDVVDAANYGFHCSGPTYYSATSGSSPYVAPALYSSDVEVEFQSQSIEYGSTVRVASNELSEGASSPRIASLTVEDESGDGFTDTAFIVTTEVADPDGDLQEVTVDLVGAGMTKTDAVSGRTDTASVTLDPAIAIGSNFDIVVTVEDGAGNTRTVTQRHASDDDGTGDGSCPE